MDETNKEQIQRPCKLMKIASENPEFLVLAQDPDHMRKNTALFAVMI